MADVTTATDDRWFFGHPKGLAFLAFTEAWERFSYYGMQVLLGLYLTKYLFLPEHIGSKTVTLPSDTRDAARVQSQLGDFIRRGVADALTAARAAVVALTPDRVLGLVGHIYEQAFSILQIMGDAEAAT